MGDLGLRARRLAMLAVLGLAATGISGCSGFDGVDFNGKIFDAVGLGPGSNPFKKSEPAVAQRAPLVLPPEGNALPAPGSAPAQITTSATDPAWPKDPQSQKNAEAEAKKAAQEKWCRDGNWKEKAVKDDVAAANGPQGGCGSIFSVVGDAIFGKKDED